MSVTVPPLSQRAAVQVVTDDDPPVGVVHALEKYTELKTTWIAL